MERKIAALTFGKTQYKNVAYFNDEIQASERSLHSLKYFYEDTPSYHIVATGSLLGMSTSLLAITKPMAAHTASTLSKNR